MKRNTLNLVIDALTLVVFLALIDTGLLLEFVLPHGAGHGQMLVLGLGRHDWGAIHFWLSVTTVLLVVLHVVLHWDWIYSTVHKHVSGARPPTSRASGRRISGAVTGALLLLLTLGIVGLMGAITVENGQDTSGGHRHGRSSRLSDPKTEAAEGNEGDRTEASPPARKETTTGRRGGRSDSHSGGRRSGNVDSHPGEQEELLRGSMTFAEVAEVTGVSVETVIATANLPPKTSPDARVGRTLRNHGSDMDQLRASLASLADVPMEEHE